jgi:glucose-1-phosphate cytidylyltransferase
VTVNPQDVPVFVLCGGLGTRIKEETEYRPKPMVPVGGHPIVWHIMRSYAAHGFRNFVLCLGYKGDVIKDYFLNYHALRSDFTIDLASNDVKTHSVDHTEDWSVTLASTGEYTMTGGRVARAAERYLGNAEHFAVTYGDGVTDVNLSREFEYHCSHDRVGTVLGVNPPSRFGELMLEEDRVTVFEEKPEFDEKWINGGYFFFRRKFMDYLSTDESCVLERTPLIDLAQDGQLNIYRHDGFWHCMDTQRDRDSLETMWASGKAPWTVP